MRTTAVTPRRTTIGSRTQRLIDKLTRALMYLVTLSISLVFFLPLLWMLTTAIKPTEQLFKIPPVWIPNPPQFSIFYETWVHARFTTYLVNTVKITALAVIGRLISCTLAGYAFSRPRWPGRDLVFLATLSTMMLPFHVLMIPQFLIYKSIGWINTHMPLWVPPFFGNAFFIFLLRQYFATLPRELDEAAEIDGCNRLSILVRILLPLARPALATVAIFTFMQKWNEFLGPLIWLNSQKKFTLSLALGLFRDQFETNWNGVMSMSFLVTLPCLILFFVAQKYFIRGIATTGLKG
jgi:multiple sugar transport system permease protein